MRRNAWHRALSLLAAVTMLAASLPVSAFAQEIPEENPAAIRTGIQPEEEAEAEDVNDLQEDAAPAEAAEPEADEPVEAALLQDAPQPEEPAATETGSAAQGVAVNGQNFPDAAFRAWILNPANLNGAGQDGTLTEDELQAVTSMDVSNQGIASLKGIEYFTNLESLNCRGNQLTQLDVNANRQLKNLNAKANWLTSLTLRLPLLKGLYVGENQLTTLDMSHNPKLEDSGFVGRNNDLRTLILPNVPGLQVDTEDFLEQDPIVGSERSEWFYDSQFTQPIREEYIPGNGQTVYARRVPNRYTVRFSANGGAGSMDSLNSEYGQQFQLPAARFTRTGYTFTGWSTRPDGPVEYQNGQTVRNLTAEDGGVVNLYAVWKRDSAMEQLSQSFAGYDQQNYIGEDWNALEAAYEAGRAGIEAAAGTAEKQAALEKAQAAMAQIPAKQARADEIINAWETEDRSGRHFRRGERKPCTGDKTAGSGEAESHADPTADCNAEPHGDPGAHPDSEFHGSSAAHPEAGNALGPAGAAAHPGPGHRSGRRPDREPAGGDPAQQTPGRAACPEPGADPGAAAHADTPAHRRARGAAGTHRCTGKQRSDCPGSKDW